MWLALIGLIGNTMLPATFVVGIGLLGADRASIATAFCGAKNANDPLGKAKPAPFTHCCALCADAPAGPLPLGQQGLARPREGAGEELALFPATRARGPLRQHQGAPPRAA